MRIAAIVILFFLAIGGGYLWVMGNVGAAPTLTLWPGTAFTIAPRWLPLPGLLVGLAAGLLLPLIPGWPSLRRDAETNANPGDEVDALNAPPPLDRLMLGVGFVAGTAALLVVIAVVDGKVDAIQAAALLICGFLAIIASAYAVGALAGNQPIEFTSYWGGLGGSMGGWRVSPATTLVLLALIFLAATVTLATGSGHPAPKNGTEANADNSGEDAPDNAVANETDGAGAGEGTHAG